MKFTTLFALLGATVAAGSTTNVETLAVKDQMKSLSNLVGVAQTRKANNMISAVSDRKAELEYQMALAGNSADKRAIARELQFLLDLVGNVESNDFSSATKTLAHRKNKLMKYSMHAKNRSLQNLEEAATEETEKTTLDTAADKLKIQDDAVAAAKKAQDDAAKVVTDAGGDVTEEQTKAAADAAQKYQDALTVQTELKVAIADTKAKKEPLDAAAKVVTDAGEDATEDDKKAEKDAQDDYDKSEKELETAYGKVETEGGAEEEAKSSKTGAIIGGVVVAGLLVGGCVYYKKKQNDNEGGEKEDKTLFKKQFKGNTIKKVQKEALVPSFAVPAEENI